MLFNQFKITSNHYADKTAVIEGERHVSYGELASMTKKLARFLRKRSETGIRVALFMENSAEYIACCYATWAAGGVVIGLNTALKTHDIINLLNHSEADWLLLDGKAHDSKNLLSQLIDMNCLIFGENYELESSVHWSWSEIEDHSDWIDQNKGTQQDGLAQIIYTSGTTGHPKGVMLSGTNLFSNIQSIQDYLKISAQDKALCVLPFFYSYGNSVLHSHITSGATLVLENSFMYPHKVLQRMADEKVTSFYGVPSTYNLLLARTHLTDYDLSNLKYCAQAGGAMDKNKIAKVKESLPSTQFIVMYGQTEASARLTYLPTAMLEKKLGSVGIPIPGVQITIRNNSGAEVATGEQGEVCAKGKNIMLGYWKDREETSKVIKDGWLYTGDVGYCDNDQYIFLVGRNKEMIKSGAHRISPREIEEVISSISGVNQVAIIGIKDEVMGQVIKACIIPDGLDKQLKKTIRRVCREKLPMYKVPKTIEFFDTFPTTASGKIKKHLLR